jgi:benzil reductase ((S)-benzoin forming)
LHPDELVDHFRIHVAAPISLYQSLAKTSHIKRMVFIDSYSASTARLGWSAYSIVKSTAQMAAMCAAQELDQTDTIRVFPGAVNTRVVDSVLASDTESAKAFAGMQKRGELAEPDEVASFIVKLLVDAPDDLIRSQPAWDYNAPDDRASLS